MSKRHWIISYGQKSRDDFAGIASSYSHHDNGLRLAPKKLSIGSTILPGDTVWIVHDVQPLPPQDWPVDVDARGPIRLDFPLLADAVLVGTVDQVVAAGDGNGPTGLLVIQVQGASDDVPLPLLPEFDELRAVLVSAWNEGQPIAIRTPLTLLLAAPRPGERVVRDIAAESDVGTFRDPHFWRQTLGKQGNVSYHGRGLKDADIAALTRALEGNTSLGKINLSANKFGDEGVLALASLLRRNATLEDVRLASNTFSEGAAEELAKALLENSSITELEVPRDHRRLIRSALHDKRRIRRETSSTTSGSDSSSTESDHGQQNDTKVPRTAKQNSARPRAGNKQGSASKNLSATSEQYWRGILGTQSDLSLRDRRLQDDEVTALAKALETNSRLQSLNLCGNLIGDDGARALAKALRSNSTLRSLHLKDNPFGIDGARALADALKDNGALSVLNGPKAHRQIFLDAIGGPRGIDRGAAAATESEDSELAFDDPDKDAPESEDSDIAMDEPDELEQGHGGSQSQHSSSSWSSGAQQVPLAVVPFREHLEVTVKEIHEEYKTYKRRERRYQLAYRSKTKSTWNGTIIREIGVLTFPKPEYGTVPFDRADFLVDLGASDALLVEFKVGKGKLKPKDKDDFIGQLRGYLDDATNFGCLEAGFSGNKWHGFGPVFRPRFIGGFMVRFDNSQSAHEPDVYWVPWPEK